MLSLLTSTQIKEADNYTIAHKPIASVDLMEDASMAFVKIFEESYPDRKKQITVYCGTGNNGGDGLAIARILNQLGYRLNVKIARFNANSSPDFNINLERLKQAQVSVTDLRDADDIDESSDIIIDALLGSGLNKPLSGEWQKLVQYIKSIEKEVVSVDVPSGFAAEGPLDSEMIHAHLAISFQRPKMNFFLPESTKAVKKFQVADIGLDEEFIQSRETPYFVLTEEDIRTHLKIREPFSHKGTYGHALIIAGSKETMGAALLCAEACLNAGAGLTTACIPESGLTALNVRIPEVMAAVRDADQLPSLVWDKYTAAAIGPGIGAGIQSSLILQQAMKNFKKPVVFDADALNLFAENASLINDVPQGSVFTPHMKEFDRLFGEHANWWGRMQTGLKQAKQLKSVIVLKNRYTFIFTPEGKCLINPTGTPAMASGGAGDVLTGIIASFLAQGYSSQNAAVLGVYIHGLCGEKAAKRTVVALPSRIIEQLSQTIMELIIK